MVYWAFRRVSSQIKVLPRASTAHWAEQPTEAVPVLKFFSPGPATSPLSYRASLSLSFPILHVSLDFCNTQWGRTLERFNLIYSSGPPQTSPTEIHLQYSLSYLTKSPVSLRDKENPSCLKKIYPLPRVKASDEIPAHQCWVWIHNWHHQLPLRFRWKQIGFHTYSYQL